MKRFSLSLKITVVFALVSVLTLGFLYSAFYKLFEQHMLKAEEQKATLIAETIEPQIGMNAYLGTMDEIKNIGEQTISHPNMVGMIITIEENVLWMKGYDEGESHIHVVVPVLDPITREEIGSINVSYSLNTFYQAFAEVRSQINYYLAVLAIVFIVFAFFTRYLLAPLGEIANKVKDYRLGANVDFSTVRVEKETDAITEAFSRMLSNIREYTVLLERYKHSVDESSIVSRMSLGGRITYVNDEFCRVCGYDREELIDSSCNLLKHPDTPDQLYEQMWSTLLDKKIWKSTLKNKRKDGDAYYLKVTVVPILDEHDEVLEYISIQNDITQIVEQQEQILRQTTDEITGLPNRIRLEEDFNAMTEPKMALLALDNYQVIKDYYGYEARNNALQDIAELLNVSLEGSGVGVYKLASGEYALLADGHVSMPQFNDLCKKMIHKIEDTVIYIKDDNFNMQASAGLTSDGSNLLTYSSLALQNAQQSKRATVIFEETSNIIETYENNIFWTKELKRAIKEDRFAVFVQPIVNSVSMKTEKYECLVRMIDPQGKVISPFHFLDIAKKSTIYHTITQRVISIAFDYFSRIPDVSFSINFSVEDLLHKETIDFLIAKLDEYNLASRLVLEIVESEGIDNFAEVSDFIFAMKKRGCKIAIDDFGTGYSNFAYLMQLNVDYIKIDGSLIRDIDHDSNAQIITATIVDFARQLDLTTVAEFVHSEAVLDYVRNLGIDYLQGYHLGEPENIQNLVVQSLPLEVHQ